MIMKHPKLIVIYYPDSSKYANKFTVSPLTYLFYPRIVKICEEVTRFMADIKSIMQDTVPISLFNRGLAGKIFEDVKKSGAKVVLKNNVAECVLLSPEEYVKLVDAAEDAKLEAIVAERLEHLDLSKCITQDEIDEEFGFTPEMLSKIEVNIE